MGEIITGRGLAAAMCILLAAGLLAACAGGPSEPAPVYLRGPTPFAAMPPPAWHENTVVTVKHGQTLGAIARTYHVSEHELIAANQLKPPYELREGARLVIPDHPATPMHSPSPALAAAATPPSPTPTQPAPSASQPAVIPLDGPAPPRQAAATPPTPQPAPAATLTPPAPSPSPAGSPAPAAVTPPPPAAAPPPAADTTGGRFPWPVSGRVLANYGSGSGDTRNEGINIGAPRGTPVKAVDGGTVAYVGNEVKGYGNLVLVKHSNGWISAYAHLDEVTVRKGDTIAAGAVIGRVGSTGEVGEPQLHFELRRGKKPVDPREFLAPAPSASGAGGSAG
jgi:murein DD-endopeptidase MepM/ murein hydrolase activator NlpD